MCVSVVAVNHVGHTLANLYRDGLNVEAVLLHVDAHHAGTRIQRAVLVEDEVADAVLDAVPAKVLNGLQCVGVVAHQQVGTGQNELVGINTLTGYGLQRVLAAPVQ